MNNNNTIKVLDHGFVKLRNLSGPVRRTEIIGLSEKYLSGELGDEVEVQDVIVRSFDADDIDPAITARISFDNLDEERSRELDIKLVEYLLKNKHTTPIEMIEVWFEMKLPIFIARQFIRHRTATVNEVSGRYTILPEEWYIPEVVGGKPTNGMKQGQEDNIDLVRQKIFKDNLNIHCRDSYNYYLTALKDGIAPEHARLFLHVNHYTHWVWKQDLHNLMHFLSLRLDSHAQVEARVYAKAIYDLLSLYLPETMKLFDKYRRL